MRRMAMSYFITNCFNWIGFHIVNDLLERGFEVAGQDTFSTATAEQLAMMVGRNDLFSLVTDEKTTKKHYQTMIVNGASEPPLHIHAEKSFKLCRGEEENPESNMVTIKLPLLFGEWMPMNEHGVYDQQTFIPFDSETFYNEAVHIEDFLPSFMQCLQASRLPSRLEIRSQKQESFDVVNGKQMVFPLHVGQIHRQVKSLTNHYRRFKSLYPYN